MNELALTYENTAIRAITERDCGWWALVDVCKILELSNPSMVVQTLDDDERAKFNLGRQGDTWFINEPGLYHVILTSRSEKAKPFRRWVTHEVLPSIRKQGYYSTMPDEELAKLIDERLNRTIGGKQKLREQREEQTTLLDLERNKISHEDYVMRLRCIWGEDSYGFHKAFDEYLGWYNQVGRRLQCNSK